MRVAIIAPTLLGLVLAGCGQKELSLPDDPVDRAATCGVVTAAAARAGIADIKAPLPFEQQGRIVHYAMLAASEGKTFDSARAAAVVSRMPELEGGITGGKWEALVTPCAEAYPATRVTGPVTLPASTLQAQTGCYALGAFLAKALGSQDAAYGDQLAEYGAMNRALDPRIGAALARQGVDSKSERATAMRTEALAKVVRLGPPMTVMARCVEKYKG